MAQLLNVSIDVTKIDKSKLIKGKKGTYLNLTISVNDEKDQFDNDVSCWHSQSKEERESKQDRNFLGNGRKLWEGGSAPQPQQDNSNDGGELPF